MDATPTTLKGMLLKHFAPAAITDERSMMKTTTDVFNIIDENAPGKFKVSELHDVLLEAGFDNKLVGDSIVWSMVAKAIRS